MSRRTATALGIDPASVRDQYAVAVMEGERLSDGTVRCTLIAITAATGVGWEDHAELALDFLSEQDQAIPTREPLLLYFDGTGPGQPAGEQLVRALATPDKRFRHRPKFKILSLQGGLEPHEIRPGWMSVGRDVIVSRAALAVRSGALDLSQVKRTSRAAIPGLRAEIDSFVSKLNAAGKEKMAAAAGERHHDDMLLALSLGYAALTDELGKPGATFHTSAGLDPERITARAFTGTGPGSGVRSEMARHRRRARVFNPFDRRQREADETARQEQLRSNPVLRVPDAAPPKPVKTSPGAVWYPTAGSSSPPTTSSSAPSSSSSSPGWAIGPGGSFRRTQ